MIDFSKTDIQQSQYGEFAYTDEEIAELNKLCELNMARTELIEPHQAKDDQHTAFIAIVSAIG